MKVSEFRLLDAYVLRASKKLTTSEGKKYRELWDDTEVELK